MVKIFIDPGHGGLDAGAVANGLQEKNLTLQIAQKMKTFLEEYENVSIRMSRTGDQTVSLTERTNAANSWGADFYISVHINAGGGTGFESYVYTSVPTRTRTIQDHIHDEILKLVNLTNRGQKQANFHVLRESHMDAVLTENGFIDTVADANKLKNSSFINSIARGHVNGLAKAFNLQKKPTDPPREEPVDGGSATYKVQIGAFSNLGNANALAERARNAGFSVYVNKDGNLYKVQIGAFSSRDNATALAGRAKNAGFDAIVLIE
ncbi:N-acetylmuramoyl-L-alanine amidase [Caldibacillus lycopersici]|uniref:N-acetylmuramoyl-L-alanine amidase n=1 Tax=Perspicuibacillus lycopersici TaxID=1325689 RepID=A0AAE3IVD0_9BACI|nr:N-acetylmuramoyl-L-alanine amidase [Perspicuibacillus lycopersici]MCU9612750.1 N-acetylmuramoyl-L-alanine amidase [Perspicuibacillus lycopersici]